MSLDRHRRTPSPLYAALAAVTLAACATTQMDAQWANPEFKGRPLRTEKVLVSCRAEGETLRRICEEEVAAQVKLYGMSPVLGAAMKELGDASVPPPAPELAAARAAGAGAVVSVVLFAAPGSVGYGPTVGIGVGGGSGGGYRGGGWSGGGVGISFPITGASTGSWQLAADTSLLDGPTGTMAWSGRIRAPGGDARAQMAEIARLALTSMRASGVW